MPSLTRWLRTVVEPVRVATTGMTLRLEDHSGLVEWGGVGWDGVGSAELGCWEWIGWVGLGWMEWRVRIIHASTTMREYVSRGVCINRARKHGKEQKPGCDYPACATSLWFKCEIKKTSREGDLRHPVAALMELWYAVAKWAAANQPYTVPRS